MSVEATLVTEVEDHFACTTCNSGWMPCLTPHMGDCGTQAQVHWEEVIQLLQT